MERLQDNRQAEQFLRLLLEADRQKEAKECRYLLEQIDDLERQLETAGRELKSLKGQLKKAERGTPERQLKTASRRVEREVKEAKEQIRKIKDSLLSGTGKAVRGFKRKGAAALDGAVDKLHIQAALRNLSRGMERAATNMQEALDRISAASAESQQARLHKKNISRILFGEAREEIPEEFTPGVLARNAIRPFAAVKGLCEEIKKQADGLEERMETLPRHVKRDRNRETENRSRISEQPKFHEEPVRTWRKFDGPQERRTEIKQQAAKAEQARRPETIEGLREYKKNCRQKNQAGNQVKRRVRGMGR